MKTLEALIAEHPFLGRMKPEHLEVLASCARQKVFDSGEIIFREGEPASQFYLIQEGKVSLEAHRPKRGAVSIQTIGAGDVLGWSWLFPPFVWHFQARALEPTKVIAFDGGHLLVTCEQNHEFGYQLMKRMAQVVIQRLQASRRKLLEVEDALNSCGPAKKPA